MLDLGPIGAFGPIMITAGSLVVVAMFLIAWRRHVSPFLATMTMGALAWAAGNTGRSLAMKGNHGDPS